MTKKIDNQRIRKSNLKVSINGKKTADSDFVGNFFISYSCI